MTDVNGKSTASGGSLGQGLEGRDCVPFFRLINLRLFLNSAIW